MIINSWRGTCSVCKVVVEARTGYVYRRRIVCAEHGSLVAEWEQRVPSDEEDRAIYGDEY